MKRNSSKTLWNSYFDIILLTKYTLELINLIDFLNVWMSDEVHAERKTNLQVKNRRDFDVIANMNQWVSYQLMFQMWNLSISVLWIHHYWSNDRLLPMNYMDACRKTSLIHDGSNPTKVSWGFCEHCWKRQSSATDCITYDTASKPTTIQIIIESTSTISLTWSK